MDNYIDDYKNIDLRGNKLITYDKEAGFSAISKYKINNYLIDIKIFRYFLFPNCRISKISHGFILEAKKLSNEGTLKEKIEFLRFLKIFKKQIYFPDNQEVELYKNIYLDELDREIDHLIDEELKNIPPTSFRHKLKESILKLKIFEPTKDDLIEYIRFSENCNFQVFKNFCYLKTGELLKSMSPTLKTIRFYKEVYLECSDELQNRIKKEARDSRFNELPQKIIHSDSDFKELIQVAIDCGFDKIYNQCSDIFEKKNPILLNDDYDKKKKEYLEIFRKHRNVRVDSRWYELGFKQIANLCANPRQFENILQKTLDLKLNPSFKKFFFKLLKNAINLCFISPIHELQNELNKNEGLLQEYLKIIQKYSNHVYEIDPDDKLFQIVNSIFNSNIFTFQSSCDLFKYIIYEYLNYKIFASDRKIISKASPSFERYKNRKLQNLSASQIIVLYENTFILTKYLKFDWLKNFLFESFSFHIVLEKILLEKESKLFLTFQKKLYPILSLFLMSDNLAHFINKFEKEFRKTKVNSKFIFNNCNTSDIKLELLNSEEHVELFLDKKKLTTFTYFQSLFNNGTCESQGLEMSFIELLKLAYGYDLKITEENVFEILHLTDKYQIEPFQQIRPRVYLWIQSMIKDLIQNSKEGDAIGLDSWIALLDIAKKFNNEPLNKNICLYFFLSINQYLLLCHHKENQRDTIELNINEQQFVERKAFLIENKFGLEGSCEIVFKIILDELNAIAKAKKREFINFVRKVLYPLISSICFPSGMCADFAKNIIDFENQFIDYENETIKFNDIETSDVTLKLSDNDILYLHREVLISSIFFKDLLSLEFENAKKRELFIEAPNIPVFIQMIKYLYEKNLEIKEENVMETFSLMNKMEIDSCDLFKAKMYFYLFKTINKPFYMDSSESEIKNLIKISGLCNYNDLKNEIFSRILKDLNRYLYTKERIKRGYNDNDRLPMSEIQFIVNKSILNEHGLLINVGKYDIGSIKRDYYKFESKINCSKIR